MIDDNKVKKSKSGANPASYNSTSYPAAVITGTELRMDILKLNFTVFNYCGLWWPDRNTSEKNSFYTVLTILTLTLMYTFTLSQTLDMILGNTDTDDTSNNLFLLLTMMSLCFKITNFLFRRGSIISLLNILREDICQQKNDTEATIRKRFDDITRSNTMLLATLSELTAAGFMISPMLSAGHKKRILPFKAWLPYSLSNLLAYRITYIQQSISIVIAAALNVVSDTLVSGLLVQACAQLDVLKDRIRSMAQPLLVVDGSNQPLRNDRVYQDVKSNVKKCVRHHVIIYKFTAMVQSVFGWVMFFQLFVSIMTFCSSVVKLSEKNVTTMEIAALIGYLACMSLQLLLHCWHGNELELKSLSVSSAVFATDWTLLRSETIGDLTMIMVRSNMPVRITCGSMITLSLQTYVMVLKASYSAFNLLQNA